MKRPERRPPTPAFVIACLALFVALGGTVLAATKIDGRNVRVKSLPGDRLEVNSLPGNRLRGTISGNRIRPGSLQGDRIDLGSLGEVPSAAHADAADTAHRAQTATAADHAEDATTINGRAVGCPEGTRDFAGACWDLTARTEAVGALDAAAACAANGGELPSVLALLAFARLPGVAAALSGEWTSDVRVDSENLWSVAVVENGITLRLISPGEPHQFRCVFPLLH